MSVKAVVTFEAKDMSSLLDAVDAFTDEMFEKLGDMKDDDKVEPAQLAAADSENWNYVVEVTPKA